MVIMHSLRRLLSGPTFSLLHFLVFGLIVESTKDKLTGEKVLVQEPYKNMTPKV